MRLWELEEGDGDNVGLVFMDGDRNPLVIEPEAQPELPDGVADPGGVPRERPAAPQHVRNDRPANRGGQPYQPGPDPMAVAREAPLVLRLGHDPNAPRPAVPPEPQAAAPAPAPARGNNARGRGGGAQRGQAAARGRGARGGRRNQRGRGQGPLPGLAQDNPLGNDGIGIDQMQLDAAQEAWIRRFVEMALVDAEDELDDDDDLWPARLR